MISVICNRRIRKYTHLLDVTTHARRRHGMTNHILVTMIKHIKYKKSNILIDTTLYKIELRLNFHLKRKVYLYNFI